MGKHKVTGAVLIALPGAVLNYVRENSQSNYTNYSAYFWLDDDRALYLHGNTGYGMTSGNFQGRFADQIGTQYFAFLDAVLGSESLLEAIQHIQSVQVDSKEVAWNGSMDDFLELLGLVKGEETEEEE